MLTIRKLVVSVEELRREMDRLVTPPIRRAVAAAVIENPCAGHYVGDLEVLMAAGAELGDLLTRRALASLGGDADRIESYGKAGIAGEAGELEHVAAILHPRFGRSVRAVLGGGLAIMPSAAKRGGPGTPIDLPLHYRHDEWVASHWDAIEIRIPDAPGAKELLIAVGLSDGGRPLARIGGKSKAEAAKP
ncbi:MAG: amino acid synthesis family protein [Alphaproteobacteria bacterium]|nr:amino acid synthesis family protein [Alphaproteobacteria bacterium]